MKNHKPVVVGTPTLDERIESFVRLAQAAEESFTEACLLLFELRREYPTHEIHSKIRKRLPISEAFLESMCEVAQKRFPARLLLYPSPGATYLQKLSYEDAERHSAEELPLVVATEQSFETQYRKFHELTPREVRQVFDGDRIRKIGEQASWLTRVRLRNAASATPTEPFEIVDDCVLFSKDTRMTADELEHLLRRLRKR